MASTCSSETFASRFALTTLADFEVARRGDLAQRCLRTRVSHARGAVLVSFARSPRVDAATFLTVQLDAVTHLLPRPELLECVNHSCDPNVSFDMEQLALVALRDLRANEELTYFYPSTEWHMAQPFECGCGASQCLGTIEGASRVPHAILSRYALSPYIRAQIGNGW